MNSTIPVLYWPFAHILGADAIKNDGVYSRYFSQYTGKIYFYGKSAHLGLTRDMFIVPQIVIGVEITSVTPKLLFMRKPSTDKYSYFI